jgi:hypothetical protein
MRYLACVALGLVMSGCASESSPTAPTQPTLPATLFTRSGVGNTVFDMPTYVSRARIAGTYTGSSSNFIVKIGGRLIVNELVGTSFGQTRYEGTHLVDGGVVAIENSTGVSWSISEVR